MDLFFIMLLLSLWASSTPDKDHQLQPQNILQGQPICRYQPPLPVQTSKPMLLLLWHTPDDHEESLHTPGHPQQVQIQGLLKRPATNLTPIYRRRQPEMSSKLYI